MHRWIIVLIVFLTACTHAGDSHTSGLESGRLCSDSWNHFIEENIQTGDRQGHGPDIGSDEWRSVVEFKLGLRGNQNLPNRNSEAWCRLVDQLVRERTSSKLSDGTLLLSPWRQVLRFPATK